MTLKDIQVLLEAGWSEQTVEDIVALVAIQKLYNTIATGLGFRVFLLKSVRIQFSKTVMLLLSLVLLSHKLFLQTIQLFGT